MSLAFFLLLFFQAKERASISPRDQERCCLITIRLMCLRCTRVTGPRKEIPEFFLSRAFPLAPTRARRTTLKPGKKNRRRRGRRGAFLHQKHATCRSSEMIEHACRAVRSPVEDRGAGTRKTTFSLHFSRRNPFSPNPHLHSKSCRSSAVIYPSSNFI